MKISWILNTVFQGFRKWYYLAKRLNASPGSNNWLIGTEIKYGGLVTEVKRNRVSPKDPRTQEVLNFGGMTGGDRMLHHGYASKYSEYLLPYVRKGEPVNLVEVGILKGTGLAIWCDLFPGGRILGLDIDLEHTTKNLGNLENRGAFNKNKPELYVFDQFLDNTEYLRPIIKDNKINICIDDGFHSNESILTTMKSILPHLSEKFVYFIEDNKDVYKEIRADYPNLVVDNEGELTIVSRIER